MEWTRSQSEVFNPARPPAPNGEEQRPEHLHESGIATSALSVIEQSCFTHTQPVVWTVWTGE